MFTSGAGSDACQEPGLCCSGALPVAEGLDVSVRSLPRYKLSSPPQLGRCDDARSMMNYPAGTLIDRFEVVSFLGEGATAQVYRVRHRILGTEHALKLLTSPHPGLRTRLLREGQLQAQLHHRNLVSVTDIIEHQGRAGLVMDFIDGDSLGAALSRDGPMPSTAALALFLPILSAVETAHRAGVLHRDLKPANILLVDTGSGVEPRVTDFGIAKVLHGDGTAPVGQTRSGQTMGTPGYMAPEQWADSAAVDVRADIFSLGVVLYAMLTAELPYRGDTAVALLEATIAGESTPLAVRAPDTPRHIAAALHRAIRPSATDRFADVAAFRHALLADPETPPPAQHHRRPVGLALLLGLGSLLAVGGVTILVAAGLMWHHNHPPPSFTGPVKLSGFSIDRTEVSNDAYQACQAAGACAPWEQVADARDSPGLAEAALPVVGVSWSEAEAYCRWRQGRLPTEAEWEQAAGRGQRRWPWGEEPPNCERANYEACAQNHPLSSPLQPGESPEGVQHLIGNVWEWTATEISRRRLLAPPIADRAVLRGGGYSTAAVDLDEARYIAKKSQRSEIYGFRCAY